MSVSSVGSGFARARETARAIVEAAAELIAERDYEKTTTNAIAERAGVSVGSLYQYFPDKRAILTILFERHAESVRPIITQFMAELADQKLPFRTTLRTFFTRLIAAHSQNPRLSKVLEEEVPPPPKFRATAARKEAEEIAHAAEVLRRRRDIKVKDPIAAAHVLHQATSALSRWLVHGAPDSLDREAYVNEAVRMLCAFVR
jgi:AcrR family transcriptional regulator